ncbi:MAG: hypothetical protein L6R40_008248 [Gallowayella cf. fulva]|nr:MAG: hypothetical protein L6R40_008248 [Xanthomendoza cf. fulva]
MTTRASTAIPDFITHLRLLDLDRLEDWPHITGELFAPKHARQNQKQRVRCVEWALYRLFELYNPKEARNKLQPFFPPYESLRSLNLRAAILRCLDQLKKDGMLGKEIVIRKTMLDECRGDRLEELLASFSFLVLQKAIRARPTSSTSMVGRLVTAQNPRAKEQGSLLPLAIAHQGALRALLREKERLREQYTNLQNLLAAKEQELLKRVDDLARADQDFPLEAVSDKTVQGIRHQMNENWEGDTKWVKTIAEADSRDVNDSLLDTKFSVVWKLAENGRIGNVGADAEPGLMQDLNRRVRIQQERLSHWQKVQQKLIDSRPKSPSKIKGKTTPYRNRALLSPLKFNHPEQYDMNGESQDGPISPDLRMQHRQLLEHSHRKSKSFKSPKKVGLGLPPKGWVDTDAFHSTTPSRAEKAPWHLDPETTPTPIVRMAESGGVTMAGSNTEGPLVAAKVRYEEKKDLRAHLTEHTPFALIRDTHNFGMSIDSDAAHQYQASPIALKNNFRKNATGEEQRRSSQTEPAQFLDTRPTTQEDTQVIQSAVNEKRSPVQSKPSLVERTRQSMAFSPVDSLLPDTLNESIPLPTDEKKGLNEDVGIELDRSSSLLERTRRSMSLLPTAFPLNGRRTSVQNRRQSRQYPTNQFVTPKKQLEDVKEVTPPDVLFSPEADYASVFKSRPKIATSPNLSPTLAEMGGRKSG